MTAASLQRRIGTFGARFGLLLLAVAFAVGFSIALPDTFPTALTFRSILDNQATIAMLAVGLTVVIAVGEFDLSLGYLVGLLHILAVGLVVKNGLSWGVAVAIVVGLALFIGLINGVLVQVGRIDSFIATLGTGTIAYAASNWYTQGQQVAGNLPSAFTSIYSGTLLGIPNVAWYVLVLTIAIWAVLEYTPTGRYLYALGANRRAAELSGIRSSRYVIGAFVASGGVVALAAVVLASRLQVGTVSTGPDFLLPVFVGAILGSTTIRPGRPNALGTIVAVAVLGIGIAGFQQLGGTYFILPLFNGSTLIIGVGLAVYAARRARRVSVIPPILARASEQPDISATPPSSEPTSFDLPSGESPNPEPPTSGAEPTSRVHGAESEHPVNR